MPQLILTKADEMHSFTVGGKAALLDELSECGFPLNFSCRRGDCGQCAATPVSGEFTALDTAMPWQQGSQILLCNSLAVGDVAIELEHLPELEEIRHLRSPCKIVQINKRSEDVLEVLLRLPPNAGFRFLPGQHIRLTNRAKVTRSYSLAEPANPDNLLRVHVRRVDGGAFSHYLFNEAAANDLLHLEGPCGTFFRRRSFTTKKLVFLATGTGIAPIYAMLLNLGSAERSPVNITLIWGNRTHQDAYLDDAIKALQSSCLFTTGPCIRARRETPKILGTYRMCCLRRICGMPSYLRPGHRKWSEMQEVTAWT